MFQPYHGENSHYSCLSWVLPVLGWGSKVSCLWTFPWKNPEAPVQLEPWTSGLWVKQFTTEPCTILPAFCTTTQRRWLTGEPASNQRYWLISRQVYNSKTIVFADDGSTQNRQDHGCSLKTVQIKIQFYIKKKENKIKTFVSKLTGNFVSDRHKTAK